MRLLPHPYAQLAVIVHADELMAAGMTRRRARMVAFLRLLEHSIKQRTQTR